MTFDQPTPSRAQHWQTVYQTKADLETSWYQEEPATSLTLISEFAPPEAKVFDVGGGSSALAGQLAAKGFAVTVIDISSAAIERAQQRNSPHAERIQWMVGDVATNLVDAHGLQSASFDLWHDRAVFHFLTDDADRRRYISNVLTLLKPGGAVVIGTFGLDGPEKCSGLPVVRYDAEKIGAVFGSQFSIVKSQSETHITPWGKPQAFCYAVLRRIDI